MSNDLGRRAVTFQDDFTISNNIQESGVKQEVLKRKLAGLQRELASVEQLHSSAIVIMERINREKMDSANAKVRELEAGVLRLRRDADKGKATHQRQSFQMYLTAVSCCLSLM